MPFESIGESVKNFKFTGILFGDFGAGKTTLASTAPKPAFIETEPGGFISIADRPEIPMSEVNSWDKFKSELRNLHTSKAKIEIPGQDKPYNAKTVVIDSFTQLQQIILRGIVKDEHTRTRGTGTPATRVHDPDVPDPRDWQRAHKLIVDAIVALNSIDTHVLLICRSRIIVNEQSGIKEEHPLMQGSIVDYVGGLMDFVGRLEVLNDGKRKLSFDHTDRVRAKFRKPISANLKTEFKGKVGTDIQLDKIFRSWTIALSGS